MVLPLNKPVKVNNRQKPVPFWVKRLLIALRLILFTLVLQFNSVSKSVIILTEIIFSVIGVLLGFAITGMEASVLMTGWVLWVLQVSW